MVKVDIVYFIHGQVAFHSFLTCGELGTSCIEIYLYEEQNAKQLFCYLWRVIYFRILCST